MFFHHLSDIFVHVWEFLTTSWRYPPHAHQNMRLGPLKNDENALMLQFFTWEANHPQMSWWKHFESEVPTLAAMGVTQVWLPPPNKAMRKQGQGYDAYDLWDLGEFFQKGTIATRWGTKEELQSAIAVANAHGIDVLIDAVLNHKLGADRPEKFMAIPVDPNNRNKEIGPVREIEGWTAYDFHGRADKYSSFKWTNEHFTGIDWDHKTRTNAIYRIMSPRHQGWSKWVDTSLNGNYDYLLGADIDHRHPGVRKDLKSWSTWVLQTTGAVGFRFDAIRHIDRRFLLGMIMHVRKTLRRNDLFSVAECWSDDVETFKPYMRVFQGLVSFFDVPLHYHLHHASMSGAAYDLRRVFDNTVVKFRPGDAVTFVDNHDTVSNYEQIGQTLESWVGSNFKLQAYALILLYGEGHPCVFYGDLYPNGECYDPAVAAGLKQLLRVRKTLAYGARTDYFQGDDPNCVGFVRAGARQRAHGGCAVLVSNAIAPAGDHSMHDAAGCQATKDAAAAAIGQTSTVVDDSAGMNVGASVSDHADAVSQTEQECVRGVPPSKDDAVPPPHSIRMNVGLENANAAYRPYEKPSAKNANIEAATDEVVKVDAEGWGDFTCPRGGWRVWARSD